MRLALFFAIFLAAAAVAENMPATTISSEGKRWTYYSAGSGAGGGKKPPLVILLHGTGGSGGGFLDKSGWAALAQSSGFVAVAPSGLARQPEEAPDFFTNPRIWNTGFGLTTGPRGAIRDDLFMLDLLHDLEQSRHIDPTRVFLVGHSNGASFAFRMAAEMPEHWAAIAPVMGVVPPVGKLAHPVPTFAVYGERDRVLPSAGGNIDSPWGGSLALLPLTAQLQRWADALGCQGEPQIISDDAAQTTHRYGVDFEVLTLKGHGHNYPQAGYPMLDPRFGPVRNEVAVNERIWSFFSRYPVGHVDAVAAPPPPGPTDSVMKPADTVEPVPPGDTVEPAPPTDPVMPSGDTVEPAPPQP